MLTMRLMRFGAKKRPAYRIVVIDSERARQSEAVDIIGFYSPIEDPAVSKIDTDKAQQWLSKGVKPSRTVQSILEKALPAKPTEVTKS